MRRVPARRSCANGRLAQEGQLERRRRICGLVSSTRRARAERGECIHPRSGSTRASVLGREQTGRWSIRTDSWLAVAGLGHLDAVRPEHSVAGRYATSTSVVGASAERRATGTSPRSGPFRLARQGLGAGAQPARLTTPGDENERALVQSKNLDILTLWPPLLRTSVELPSSFTRSLTKRAFPSWRCSRMASDACVSCRTCSTPRSPGCRFT